MCPPLLSPTHVLEAQPCLKLLKSLSNPLNSCAPVLQMKKMMQGKVLKH